MKKIIAVLFLWLFGSLFYSKVNAQKIVSETNDSVKISEELLKQSITALDQALLNKDSTALQKLLNDEVEITHSNGWVQKKQDVFEDFRDSTLSYNKVECQKIDKIVYRADIADVNRMVKAKGKFETYDFDMRLNVTESWIYKNGSWQLWSRRSEKVK